MPLIVIHNHVHLECLETLNRLEAKLDNLLKITTMSQEILDELNNKVLGLKNSLTNIKADIQKIKDSLPTTGGLTEAEVASLRTSLDEAGTQAAELDAENE